MELGRTTFSLLFLCTFSHTLKKHSKQLDILLSVLGLKETIQARIKKSHKYKHNMLSFILLSGALKINLSFSSQEACPDYTVYPLKSTNMTLNACMHRSVHW